MRLADNGSAVTLTEAVRDNAEDLLAYFQRRLEHREDAADAVGEVLLVAARRQRQLPLEPEQARMWLFGIAQRVRLNAVRSRRRRGALFDKLRAELTPIQQPHHENEDLRQQIRDAVASLSPKQAELIRLVHWDGFSIADASRLMGITPSAGRSRYATARHSLATELEASGLPREVPYRSEALRPS